MVPRCLYPNSIHSARTLITTAQSFRVSHRVKSQIRHYAQPPERVVFSGIQPTGVPHLGNYLGALQQWVQLQKEAPRRTRLFFCIVDLHAITLFQDPRQLQKWKRETLAALLAVGLDPDRCTLFFQSSVRGFNACYSITSVLAQCSSGTSTLRAHVDIELHRFCRVSVAYDTMEGQSPLETIMCVVASVSLTP